MYRTVFLPAVLYGRQTWSPTLRKVHALRVFEDKVLRRIFGPKRDEVTGGNGKQQQCGPAVCSSLDSTGQGNGLSKGSQN
jgi:hypothetical protein